MDHGDFSGAGDLSLRAAPAGSVVGPASKPSSRPQPGSLLLCLWVELHFLWFLAFSRVPDYKVICATAGSSQRAPNYKGQEEAGCHQGDGCERGRKRFLYIYKERQRPGTGREGTGGGDRREGTMRGRVLPAGCRLLGSVLFVSLPWCCWNFCSNVFYLFIFFSKINFLDHHFQMESGS